MAGKRRAPSPRASTPRTLRSRVWRVGRWFLALGLVGVLVAVLAFVVTYRAIDIPDPNADFLTETSKVYYADGDEEIGEFATQDRESIPYDEMPETVRNAVVAAEDRTFWTNEGIDPRGIVRAAFNNAQGGETQGASTITQQYVKILYLTQEQSLKRKIKEAILSLKVQRSQSKKQVLEGYLNTIYFGRGAYGIQAASQAFFDKPAADLDLRESAALACVINNPSRFDPDNGKDARTSLRERYEYTLDGMAEAGDVSEGQAQRAARRLPPFPEIEEVDTYGGQSGHMLRLVRAELQELGFDESAIDGQGLRVTTTFTPQAMTAAQEGAAEARPEGFGAEQLHVGVASVEPGTGALRGFFGGQDYLDSQINWAATGGMIGSTMKPVTLATALENGFSLEDTFEGNSPYEFPDGLRVRNEGAGPDGLGNDYGSSVDAVAALEESINTAFVDMSVRIPGGPEEILATANDVGIPPAEPSNRFPGIPDRSVDLSEDDSLLTLGRARVSPINMANAYATFAARGEQADVHVVETVTDADGEELYSRRASTTQAVDQPIADDVSYAMQEVVADGTGATVQGLGRPAAGKTGTATNDADAVSSAWFVGYTPQLATAVMYVRGDGDDQLDGWLPSYFGSAFPADTWLAVMQRALEGTEVEEFPPPANVDGDAPDGSDEVETEVPDTDPTTSAPPPPSSTQPTTRPSRTPRSSAPPSSSAPPTSSAPPSSSAPPPSPTRTTPTLPTGPSSSGTSSPTRNPRGGGSPSG